MASNNNLEESNPLLSQQQGGAEDNVEKPVKISPEDHPTNGHVNVGGYGWIANGLPLGHGSVVGEPVGRNPWDSNLCACLGRNDEFCSSDLEVCEYFLYVYEYFFGCLCDLVLECCFNWLQPSIFIASALNSYLC